MEVAHIACGGDHTCAVSRNGEVFTWGRGSWGQLGHGTLANEVLPRQVVALAGKFAVQASSQSPNAEGIYNMCLLCHESKFASLPSAQAAAGSRHTLVLTVSGRVHAFGSGESGQLGTGTDAMHALPVRVQGLRGLHVTRLAAGGLHSCAVGDLGAGWGPAGIRTGQASMDKGPRVPGAGMGFHRRCARAQLEALVAETVNCRQRRVLLRYQRSVYLNAGRCPLCWSLPKWRQIPWLLARQVTHHHCQGTP